MAYQTNGINYPNAGWNNPYYQQPQNGYMPQQNFYQPVPMTPPQLPTYEQPPTTSRPINGHTVGADSDITPNDVPMDGSISLFPIDDYSCIFAKQWTKDGKITTTKFVPVPMDEEYIPTPGFEDEMRSSINEIKNLIQNMSRNNKQRYRNNKSEDDGNVRS